MTVQGKYNYNNVSRWSKKLPGGDIFNLRKIFIPINEKNKHWRCIVIFMKEKQIQYYDSLSVGAGNIYMNDILQYLVDEDKGQGRVKREEWTLVPSKESVPKQKNWSDCGAFICMFGYFISQDASLEFTQDDVTSFQEQMELAIINCANNTEVQADSDEDSSSSSNTIQNIEPVKFDISKCFPDRKILSSTNDGFYVAKLRDKLPQNIVNYLHEYINKCFEGNKLAERQFKYYQTTSDENAQLEMNIFTLAKGLFKGLNQGEDQSNIFAPLKAELINSMGNCCQVTASTKSNTTPLAVFIVVPLWHKNDESITIKLQLQPKGKQIGILTCQLKKGDAYLIRCKNHKNQKPKCKVNSVKCALHCKAHTLVMDSTQQDFQALVISFILPDTEDLKPPQGEQSEEHDSRYILYTDKMFKLVDNDGNGLCLFYSVSCFLQDLVQQGASSTPDAWFPFIGLKNSTTFCESKAALSLTQFLCTISEADFKVLIEYFGFNDDKITKQLPAEYTLIVEYLRDNVLVNTEQDLKENIVKWVNRFIYEMINATNTTDGSWPGDIHALVLRKMLKIRIVIVSNY
jgi:hypothetical protein